MNRRDKTRERNRRRADASAGFRKASVSPGGAPATSARWLLPAISLAFACAAVVVLVVKNRSEHSEASGGTSQKERGKRFSFQLGTNLPSASGKTRNGASTEFGVDLIVKLVAEGNEFLQRSNYIEAAARFSRAVKVEPGDEDLHYNLAIALAKLGLNEEAKQHYEEALKIFPDYVEAHNNLGNLLMNENKLSDAIAHFQEAIRIMPENPSAHNNLGTAYGRLGRIREAAGEFAEAVRRKPSYVEARVNLANAYLSQEKVEEAVAQLNEALRLQPDFQPAIKAMQRARLSQSSSGIPK